MEGLAPRSPCMSCQHQLALAVPLRLAGKVKVTAFDHLEAAAPLAPGTWSGLTAFHTP